MTQQKEVKKYIRVNWMFIILVLGLMLMLCVVAIYNNTLEKEKEANTQCLLSGKDYISVYGVVKFCGELSDINDIIEQARSLNK